MKLALAMIVKPSDSEALILERALSNMAPHVDGVFITQAGKKPNKAVSNVIKEYGGVESFFEWVDDFSAARNYNFSQVPQEYDYILWADADDVYRGLETLKGWMKKKEMDVYGMWYLYDFDEYNQPTVVHKKTMVVRNDGCVTWAGRLHEDFIPKRTLESAMIPSFRDNGVDRIHLKESDAINEAKERNVHISEVEVDNNPNDPRSHWNVANSYIGNAQYDEAISAFTTFLETSQSDEEKYLATVRTASAYFAKGESNKAIEALQRAVGMKPDYPDAYYQLGFVFFERKEWDNAERYTLAGLTKKPPYNTVIVYNPRDYDYNPMMMLAKIYFNKSRPDLALPMLQGCLKIYPDNEQIKSLVAEMEKEKEAMVAGIKVADKLRGYKTDKAFLRYYEKLDPEIKENPAVQLAHNQRFVKTESSGKDVYIYCYNTTEVWHAGLFKTKGFGGSEEAVVNLADKWAEAGYNVTVYNNCGADVVYTKGYNTVDKPGDGVVTYRPYFMFNTRDVVDYLILWRTPGLARFDLGAKKVFVDVHDVIPAGDFTPKVLNRIDGVFVKSDFHRSLFPNVPDEKVAIIPNGINLELQGNGVAKDQYLMVNTSSPDRSLDVLPKLFKKVKERVPEAKCEWAYGWGVYEAAHSGDQTRMEWKRKVEAEMAEAGIVVHGRVTQREAMTMYERANVLAYPTEFAEIDCITARKAQLSACLPITSDFAALETTNKHGIKVKSDKTAENWAKPYQFHFGIEDESKQDEWVDAVVKTLKTPIGNRNKMQAWAAEFNWSNIAEQWLKRFH